MPKTKQPTWHDMISETDFDDGLVLNDDGELDFVKPQEKKSEKKPVKPSAGKPVKGDSPADKKTTKEVDWERRYKDLQAHTTRVSQTNAEFRRKMAKMERDLDSIKGKGTNATTPSLGDPGIKVSGDLEEILSNTDALRRFVVGIVGTQLPAIGKFIDDRLAPLAEVKAAYDTHKELVEVTKSHKDFPLWREEMEKILASRTDEEEISLEELYQMAREQHPDKAFAIDSGTFTPNGGEENQETEDESETPDSDEETEVADGDEDTVDADELQAIADRTETETGVGSVDPVKRPGNLRETITEAMQDLLDG